MFAQAKKPPIPIGWINTGSRETDGHFAAAKAAPTTPTVQANGGPPVNVGLAKSLARPGGMVTGITNIATDIAEKYLVLLLAAAPKLQRIGVLIDAGSANRARHLDAADRQSNIPSSYASLRRSRNA